MSDQEVKGKKSGRGRGRNKLNATSYSSGVKDTEKSQQSAGSKKSGNKKKGSTTTTTSKGLKVGRGRGRIRIEDSSSEEEPVVAPKEEPIGRLEIHKFPVTVKKELSSELEEKVSDENFINRVIKTDKLTFPEVNHLSLIHTTSAPSYDLVDDIAPSLSFVGPRANIPLHNNKPLAWNHKVNLIGDKCPSPRIHICEKCERPILLYGRLIPCKHVFCYDCAKANPVCLRCTDKVLKVDKNKLGAVFMCTYENCRRTYLSHRDLQAHVLHRHLKRSANQQQSSSSSSKQSPQVASTNPSNSLTVASPSTSIGSSSMKTNSFSSRNKTNPMSGIDFSRVTSRATSSSIPLSFDDPINDRKYSSYLNAHQQSSSSSSSSKTKLSGNKNLVMSGKSPNLTSSSLVNLPRCWPSSGQPSSSTISSASLSFTSPTLPQSLSTSSSWNSPLISDPRSSTTINRHFYQ